MRPIRSVVAALVGAALLVSACASSGGTARALHPRAWLDVGFTRASYTFAMTANEGRYTGGIDPVAGTLDATVTVKDGSQTLTVQTRGVGGQYFAKLTGTPLPDIEGKWFQVDMSRVGRDGSLGISVSQDPTGVRGLVAAVTSVQSRGGGTWRGIADLRKVTNWGPVTAGRIAQIGDAARLTHFEATVDDSRRLTSMRVWVPGNPANVVTAKYSGFDTKVPVTAPAGAQPLPDSLYALLNL
jgi:hypothetical protein